MTDARHDPRATVVDYDPFADASIELAVPTTDAQREVWLACQFGPEASLAYNESISLQIRGRLDAAAMQQALQQLSDRHESLRATLSPDGLSLLVAPNGRLYADEVDLSSQAPEARAQALAAIRRDAVTRVFDLVNGPLVRAQLVRLEAESHELVFTAHHVICDGWSFGVISRDLMAIYRALAEGNDDAGLPPADRFSEYAVTDVALQQAAEADEKYWLSVYDGSVPVLDLPVDRPRGKQRQFTSRREDLRIEPAVVEGLRKAAAARGVSLFAAMFGLYAGLMERLSGESDLVVGVPAAGQATRGMQGLVGHCVNLLPVRVGIDPKAPAEAMLGGARGRVLDAYDHQACTYGRLLSKLQLARDASRLPLVSVQFNLDTEIDPKDLSVAGLEVSLRSNPREYENFDLFVNATQAGGAIVLECQYNAALFEAATVRHWLQVLAAAAERYAADPTQPAAALYRAADADLSAYEAFNRTALDVPQRVRAEQLVIAQVGRTPDASAVEAGDARLDYRELHERSNAVAAELVEQGVRPGDLVGLACGRNEHLVVGLLGILKAGAGYVPLDPGFPAERLAYMRRDAGLQRVVADASTEGSAATTDVAIVRADSGLRSADVPDVGADTLGAGYVLYTSGSTGQPKGVVVPQHALVNFLFAMLEAPGLASSDRLVAVTTASFDIAILEMLLPLIVGATVIIADRDTVKDPMALRALLERSNATVMQATPSGWRIVIESGWAGRPDFKALIGGEPLPRDLAESLLARTAELWNGYGPTETTVYSSNWRVPRHTEFITIGRPVANTVIDVLDDQLRLCPVGVPGEICIGGAGVADGYMNRPDLTAEKFVADPRRPGQRLYRTGDRGRLRSDGLLEHLGRMDFQVKVRGYRIELGDVEANLAASEELARCVVVVREDRVGDPRLVAYCVLADAGAEHGAARDRLREHARRRLPPYMVPQHFEFLDAIPLLPNGKVNRKALPRPGGVAEAEARVLVEPSTDVERIVHAAMRAVLSVPELGMDDDFFLMGGHSLLASRLLVRLNRELGLAVPLRMVFEHPTAAGLARELESTRSAGTLRARAEIRSDGAKAGPLTVMQERIRFMEAMHPGRVVYNTPSAHRLKGDFDVDAFRAAFKAMVQRQPTLRTVITSEGPDHRQTVLDTVPVNLGLEDLSGLPADAREHELMRRLHEVIDRPIPIDEAPLFRARLYRLAPEDHVFLFMPHHIVWDGWSFDLLYEEISELYAAELQRRPAVLPVLPVTYVDYARWHGAWMQGEECESQVGYWRCRYEDLGRPEAIPTDHPRTAGMTGRGAVEWIHVDRVLTERLRKVALDCGATLNMLLLAVYSAMLTEVLDRPEMVLGIPVRGRLVGEVENVMGFFNNLLPMPIRVERDRPFADWVRVVKSALLEAFANQDVPFERLMQDPGVARHAGAAGLYQSLFSFQDARERRREWGPLSHSSVLVMQKGATEDLGLWLMEVPGGLEGGVNYNLDLFEPATVERIRRRLLGLLDRAAANPAATVSELLAALGDERQAVVEWARAARRDVAAAVAAANLADPAGTLATLTALDERTRPLAVIWATLLGIEANQVRADDNFFDLGGNSLLVMQAVSRMERELGLVVDPRRYVYETLEQLIRASTISATVSVSAPKTVREMRRNRSGWLRGWIGRDQRDS